MLVTAATLPSGNVLLAAVSDAALNRSPFAIRLLLNLAL
jgi:hypothetical protein